MILWDRKTIKASLTRPEAAVLIVMIESKILNWNFSSIPQNANGNHQFICLKRLIAVQLVAGPPMKLNS
jgi:hypothetical protein